MYGMEEIREYHDSECYGQGKTTVVLYGCEAHICVKQTALDLMERNFDVFVVVDACTSMEIPDRNVGIAAMQAAGVQVTTFQSLVLDLIKTSEHPKFKSLLPILKDNHNPGAPLDLFSQPRV